MFPTSLRNKTEGNWSFAGSKQELKCILNIIFGRKNYCVTFNRCDDPTHWIEHAFVQFSLMNQHWGVPPWFFPPEWCPHHPGPAAGAGEAPLLVCGQNCVPPEKQNKTKKRTNKCLVKQSGYQPLLRNINSGDEPSLLWGIWDKYDAMWLPVYLPCSQQLFQWPSWQQHIGPFPAEGTLYARLYTQPVQPQNCLFLQDTSALMRLWVHANGCPLKKEETDFG